MSVKVMTSVFDRYPNGGGEMLLALALADHASDDGSRVFPSVKALSEKTRQSERTVQYQLRRMEEMGWLIVVGHGNGGRSMSREYRISLDWIKGANIAPFQKGAIDDTKGATTGIKGCNLTQERVQTAAPANNHHGIIKEPSEKKSAYAPPLPDDLLADFLSVRKAKKAGPLTKTAVAGICREAEKAGISLIDAVTACCEFGWQGFNAAWYAERQAKASQRTSQAPSIKSFKQSDDGIARARWEEMTGRTHPDNLNPQLGHVIDITPQYLEIAQ